MIISVTKKDIENGRRGACSQCPVALAFNHRYVPGAAFVFEDEVWIGDDKRIVLPEKVRQFIRDFDAAARLSRYDLRYRRDRWQHNQQKP